MTDHTKLMKTLAALAVGALLFSTGRAAEAKDQPARVLDVSVTEKGIEPATATVKKGQPLELHVTRKTDQTCATELAVPDQHIQVALPLNKPVTVRFTPRKAGTLRYGCAMGMMVGATLVVE